MLQFSHNIEDYPQGIVLAIDKPYRWTSADVVGAVKYAAKRHFGKKNLKVGHAGTLDPLATGILLVCIGPATRRAEELQRSPKAYEAGVCFGATTASYDREKAIEGFSDASCVSRQSLLDVLPTFIGEQMQVAPLFSAKSVDGVRVYEIARQRYKQGLPLEDESILQANPVTIYDMQLLDFSLTGLAEQPDTQIEELAQMGLRPNPNIKFSPMEGLSLPGAMIRVRCSKGTYIRSLARDLGEALGTKGFLSSLRRVENGGYTIDQALTLSQVLRALGSCAANAGTAASNNE